MFSNFKPIMNSFLLKSTIMNTASFFSTRSAGALLPLLLITLFSGSLLSACGDDFAEPEAQTPVEAELRTAEVATTTATHRFPGRIESVNQASLSTIVMGSITEVRVNEGDRVQEGELLVRIKDDQIRAQKRQTEAGLMQLQAQLELVEKNYERIRNLHAQDSATDSELDEITAQYEGMQARMEQMKANMTEVDEMLAYTRITAPFDGIVSRKMMSAGDLAAPGMPLLRISGPEALKIRANVPESMINRLSDGMPVRFSVPSAGIEHQEVMLSSINQAGDPMSRQFTIEAVIPAGAATEALRTGMYADVLLRLEDSESVLIPESALVRRGQLTGIYTLTEDNRALLRWIRTGRTSPEGIEVISGLSAGEVYVADARRDLRQGQPIQR